jgi:hypothetical protein
MTSKKTILSLLIASAIFLAPLNLFLKWGELNAYVGGIFSDYLLLKFWLGEIPVILTLIIWLPKKIFAIRQKILPFLKKNWLLIIGSLLLIARQFFTPLPIVSVWYLLLIVELVLFVWCFKDNWPKIDQRLIKACLLVTLVFQTIVASLQFLRQQSLFVYQVLGETQLTHAINIARVNFKTGEKILAYGTTAHPNILAGVGVILGLLWLQLQLKNRQQVGWLELGVVVTMAWLLFITQAYSAILALTVYLLVKNFPKLKSLTMPLATVIILGIPLMMMLLADFWLTNSLARRTLLNAHAVAVFGQQPILGVGLGMFTLTLKSAAWNFQELVRFIQPAHHVGLLLLTELGLLGLAWLAGVWQKIKLVIDPAWLLMLAILLSLDHYLITQWTGLMALALVGVIAGAANRQPAK